MLDYDLTHWSELQLGQTIATAAVELGLPACDLIAAALTFRRSATGVVHPRAQIQRLSLDRAALALDLALHAGAYAATGDPAWESLEMARVEAAWVHACAA